MADIDRALKDLTLAVTGRIRARGVGEKLDTVISGGDNIITVTTWAPAFSAKLELVNAICTVAGASSSVMV